MSLPNPEFSHIVVTRIEVLFSHAIKETIFEVSFIDEAQFMKYFFALAIFTISKVVACVSFIACMVLSITLESSSDPGARVSVAIC